MRKSKVKQGKKENNSVIPTATSLLENSTDAKLTPYQLHDLINTSPIGIIVVGENFSIEFVNQSLADLFLMKAEEMIGKDFRQLLSRNEQEVVVNRYQSRRKGKETPEKYQISVLRSDGKKLHLDLTSAISKDDSGNIKTISHIIDITDKVEISNTLEETQSRYKTLVENSPYAIILSTLEAKLISVNQKTVELFGYDSSEDIINTEKTLVDFVADHERKRSFFDAQRTIQTDASGPYQYTFLKKNGSSFLGELSATIIKDTSDKPLAYMAMIHDVSKRFSAETELKESKEFISAIANTTPAMIHVFDLKVMKQIYINDAVINLLGYTPGELLGIPTGPEDGLLHPDDRDLSMKHLQELREEKTDKVHEIIYRLRHKNGEYRVFKSFERPFQRDESGNIIKLIGVTIDITDQEAVYENLQSTTNRLSNIMKAANDGMWDWYLDSGKVIFDPRYFQMAGYEIDEFPYHLDEFAKRVHPEDTDRVMQTAQEHLEGKIDRFIVEFRFQRKDRTWMWILGRGIIVERDNEGKPLRLLGTHTDITELKHIQNDLEEAKNKAEESDRLKSAFLANMSHEIRTPMNGILGFADLLKNESLSLTERKEYVSIIERSGYRMLNTINDIIDLSKIEAGQTDIVKTAGNLNEQLNYLHEFFLPEAEKKEMTLVLSVGLADNEADIITDHEKVIAICSNLLKNALKYSFQGFVEFGYTLSEENLLFSVKDTGIGIAKDRQEAIFERFVQEDLTITKAYEGSGLGLSISKGYVELMGGSIWVDSEPGKGSVFYFTIPYIPEKEAAETITETTTKTNSGDRLKKVNVLIADDDESTLFYLTEILKRRCNRIIQAKTGKEVVELCRSDPHIGIILMDIKMPEIDGYEATRQIREFNKDVIIIGQTAYALVGDRQKVLDAGCNDYITKPINKEELLQKIEKYL